MSGSKFFGARRNNRPFDTLLIAGSQAGSYSFHTRAGFTASNPSSVFFDIRSAGTAPVNSVTGGKSPTRSDTLLHVNLPIPKYSKILGGELRLTLASAPTIGTFTGLTVGLYPELSRTVDIDNWRGGSVYKGSLEFAWRHTAVDARPGSVSDHNPERANYWCQIYEGVTVKAQSPVAATGTKTLANNTLVMGQIVTDKDSGNKSALINGMGQVLQIDGSSSAISSVEFLIQRSGTYSTTVNLVCKAYRYDASTNTKGALVATSDAITAGGVTTSNTTVTTFTFSSTFAVTAGDYMLFTVEPQTTWNINETAVIFGRYVSLSGTGSGAIGSKEIMWWMPKNTGNSSIHMIDDDLPLLYNGLTGTVIEDQPPFGGPFFLNFKKTPTASGEVVALPFNAPMIRAIENVIRGTDYDLIQGLRLYLASAPATGGSLAWSTANQTSAGIYVNYRSTRVFIT